MSDHRSRNLRALRLGQYLKRMRETANLTLRDVGNYIRRDPGTVSRIESGAAPARVPEVLAYLDLCGQDRQDKRDALRRMSDEVFKKGWWDGSADQLGDELLTWIWVESMAERIECFETTTIPGLLQTRKYAEALARNAIADEQKVKELADIRLKRQGILHQDNPTAFDAIIDEAVFQRHVGGKKVMAAQIQHLIDNSEQRHITVRVLPFKVSVHPGIDGSFNIFRIAASVLDAAAVDTQVGAVVVEGDAVEHLSQTYNRLNDLALTPSESTKFLTKALKEHK